MMKTEVDVAVAPQRLLDLCAARVGGSRCTDHDWLASAPLAAEPLEDDAQVPVAHAVAEEQEVALVQALAQHDAGSWLAMSERVR